MAAVEWVCVWGWGLVDFPPAGVFLPPSKEAGNWGRGVLFCLCSTAPPTRTIPGLH